MDWPARGGQECVMTMMISEGEQQQRAQILFALQEHFVSEWPYSVNRFILGT